MSLSIPKQYTYNFCRLVGSGASGRPVAPLPAAARDPGALPREPPGLLEGRAKLAAESSRQATILSRSLNPSGSGPAWRRPGRRRRQLGGTRRKPSRRVSRQERKRRRRANATWPTPGLSGRVRPGASVRRRLTGRPARPPMMKATGAGARAGGHGRILSAEEEAQDARVRSAGTGKALARPRLRPLGGGADPRAHAGKELVQERQAPPAARGAAMAVEGDDGGGAIARPPLSCRASAGRRALQAGRRAPSRARGKGSRASPRPGRRRRRRARPAGRWEVIPEINAPSPWLGAPGARSGRRGPCRSRRGGA